MSTFAWFSDAGLTAPLTRADFTRGSTAAPVDKVVYFGSPATGKKLQSSVTPGTTALQVAVSDAAGGGVAVGDVKLALSSVGLGSATGGAALNIGTTILSGAVNAVPVFARLTSSLTTIGNYDDVSLSVSSWVESNV